MTFMGIIFIQTWDCAIIPDAFIGVMTIMGTIFMQVMLAGQAFIMGFAAMPGAFICIIPMQFIPAGHAAIIGCIIFPDVIISPAMGSIAAIATIPINARIMADVNFLDVVFLYPPNRVTQILSDIGQSKDVCTNYSFTEWSNKTTPLSNSIIMPLLLKNFEIIQPLSHIYKVFRYVFKLKSAYLITED